jgi:hypothetical protein
LCLMSAAFPLEVPVGADAAHDDDICVRKGLGQKVTRCDCHPIAESGGALIAFLGDRGQRPPNRMWYSQMRVPAGKLDGQSTVAAADVTDLGVSG